MKKTITVTLIISLISCILFSIPVSATITDNTEKAIEYLENGNYIETIITDDTENSGISLYATNTITKTKTKYYKNSSGTVLTRPPKVRPKKSNFGGRYFYVKIQL